MDSVLNTENYHLRLVFSVPRSGSMLLYNTLLSNLKGNREFIIYNYNDNSLNKLNLFNYYSGYIYTDTIFLHSHMNKFDIPFASKKAIFLDRKDRKAQAISLALADYSSIYEVFKDSSVESQYMTNWKDMYGIGVNEFNYSVKSMLSHLDLQRRCIKNMLSKGFEYYTLYYEDMLDNWEDTIKYALDFLFDLKLSEYNYKKYTVKLHSQDFSFNKLICNSK